MLNKKAFRKCIFTFIPYGTVWYGKEFVPLFKQSFSSKGFYFSLQLVFNKSLWSFLPLLTVVVNRLIIQMGELVWGYALKSCNIICFFFKFSSYFLFN